MNPIRPTGAFGKERRTGERNRLIIFWTLIGICAVVSSGSLIVAYQSKSNAERSERAHCVLVKFLVGSNLRNQASIDHNPNGPNVDQQRSAVEQTAGLIKELRHTGIHCIPIPQEVLKKGK